MDRHAAGTEASTIRASTPCCTTGWRRASAGYDEFVKTWESLIEEEFFTDLLNSIVPDAAPDLPQLAGLTKLERVKAIARGCGVDEEHSLHVAELSLQLFDGLRSLHRLGDAEREHAGICRGIA